MSTIKIAKSATIVSLITMLSRILGYVRDAICAALLGVGFVSDAFFVAFRIPNLLRNLLAEGALSSAFIPVFTEYLEKREKKDILLLLSNVLTVLSIILIGICFLGIIFAPQIVYIIAPGFGSDVIKFDLTVNLTRFLFPFIFLISIAALFMGILNSLKKFSIPAFAPVVLNVSMILSGFFVCPMLGATPEKQVYGWVIGILFGAILEIIIQFIPAIKYGLSFRFFIDIYDEGLRKIGKLMLPATLAQSVTQINILVNTILASFLIEGSVTYLYYGNRLMQLPLGVFGVAIATVSFPYISSYAATGNIKDLNATINSSLKQAFFIVIPASFGIIFLSKEINTLLFYYGRFSYADAIETAKVSIVYSVAIFAFSGIKILTQVFYAINRAGTAVKISIFSMVINIILCIALMFPFQYIGLALATSIAGIINFLLLYTFIIKYTGNTETKNFIIFSLKVLAVSLIMGILIRFLADFLYHVFSLNIKWDRKINALITFICILSGIFLYFLFLKILKFKELNVFIDLFKNKFKRSNLESKK